MYHWKGLAGLLLVGALLLAACGGDSGGSGEDDGTTVENQSPADSSEGEQSAPAAELTAPAGKVPADGASVAESDGDVSGLPLGSQLDRKIVSTATLTLETEGVSARYQDVGAIASAAGGYISDSTFGREGDRETASVTIRVPVDRYQDVLRQLRGMGNVVDESSAANDVTEQFTDLDARLRNLRATEAQYLEFLDQAQNLEETLLMQDRINNVRLEIEQVQGRMQLLEQTSSLATITVHLQPPPLVFEPAPEEPKAEKSLSASADEAFDASLEFLEGAARVVISVGAFGWWLAPLAGLGVYFGRKSRPKAPARTEGDS